MRTNKNGTLAISKLVWVELARVHLQIADELGEVVAEVRAEGPSDTELRLLELQTKHLRQAVNCRTAAANTKRGAPKKYFENALQGPTKPKKRERPGRPTDFGPKYDQSTYIIVEQRRKDMVIAGATKATVKAAIDSLNEELAPRVNRRVGSFVKDECARIRSCYQRGKRAVERDQNPK